jgi:hypothetical protein
VITVTNEYGTQFETKRGEQTVIDDKGNLHVQTTLGEEVATFAAGYWRMVAKTPNRDAHGRFTKQR